MHTRPGLIGFGAALALAFAMSLTGCTAPSVSLSEHDGPSSAFHGHVIGDQAASWVAGGQRIAVLTAGSSSCAPYPVSVKALDKSTVEIELATGGGAVCTADLAEITFEVRTPDGVELGGDVEVVLVTGEFRSSLPIVSLGASG